MIVRALFLVVAAFLGVVLPCAEAWAQTGTTIVLGKNIERRADRPSGIDTKSINYEDCKADDTLGITYTLSGTTVNLEVWAGLSPSCADLTFRTTGANAGQCWQVASQTAAMSSRFALKVRDVLKHDDSNAGTEAVCDPDGTGTGSGTIVLYFVLLSNDTTSAGMGTSQAIAYDLQGPAPPTGLTALLGDARLYPTWTLNSSAETDSKGYYLYCQEAENSSPCEGSTLKSGERPPTDEKVRGTTGPSVTSGEASGLTNGTTYACGVAGYDALSNVGKLSDLVCATPEPVNGYYKLYRAAGGTAGGGYCSFARRAATPAGAATSLFAVALLFLRRRGRRRAA